MIIELIISVILGIFIGTITGLLPGIHINLVSAILLSLPLSIISPISAVLFITSLSITHIFIDFIPTIFLACPDEDTSLSILPGHELLLQGNGHEAVVISIIGCLIGTILLIPLIPIFLILLPTIYELLKNIIPLVLIIISLFMLIFEKPKLLRTLFIMILSAALGLSILSFNLNIKEPLLPLLTGLFGSSSLILSISKKQNIPNQDTLSLKQILKENKQNLHKPLLASLISAPICSFLPALGSNQASTISSYIIGDLNKKQFLILIGIVNSLVMSLSFITLYIITKSRTGSAVYINKLLPALSSNHLILIILTIIIVSILIFPITLFLSRLFSQNIYRINYNLLSIAILIFLSLIILYFSGVLGFFVFTISTSLGITCILLNVRRTSLMTCLIAPTILYYIV
jgi:putative membrane protein